MISYYNQYPIDEQLKTGSQTQFGVLFFLTHNMTSKLFTYGTLNDSDNEHSILLKENSKLHRQENG